MMAVSYLIQLLVIWNFTFVLSSENMTEISRHQHHNHNHNHNQNQKTVLPPLLPPPPRSPTSGGRLKMAVPPTAYKEFVSITYNNSTGEPHFDGFSIKVFQAINFTLRNQLPIFDLVPYSKKDGTINGSYDSMLQAVSSQEYDGVVGDTTIRYDRTQWVDFTLPYSDTGVTMMVFTKQQLRKSSGIKVIPFIKGLVYAAFGVCFVSAIIFWFVEFRNDKNRPFHASLGSNPLGLRSNHDEYWRRETMRAIIQTRLVVVMCFLVLLFVSSCYAASLTSLLTTHQPKTPITTLDELIRQKQNVGILSGSFVARLLKEKGFSENQIHSYNSEQEMVDMMSKGNAKGGIVAVIDEAPYLKLFISKNCNEGYILVPSLNLPSEGLGFAFRKGAPWLSDFSNGILKLMDEGKLTEIQRKTMGDLETCHNDSNNSNDVDSNLLDFDTMWILFAGAIGVAVLVIILYMVYLGTTCDTIRRRIAYPCYFLPNVQERKN